MDYKLVFNKNKNKQVEQAIRVLASWIGDPDSNSTRSFRFFTIQNNSIEIQKLNLENANKLKKIDDFLISSNKDAIQNKEGEIFILSIV